MFDQEIFVENQHRTKVRKTGYDLIQLCIPSRIPSDLNIELNKKKFIRVKCQCSIIQ